ncbi:MAG: acyl-CoA synthetase (NDP forming), partial [Gammaproteobacteria bacterium]
AGSHRITSAFLKRNGFGQAESIPVFLETLKLLHLHGPLNGYRISSMSCSGGEASIIADAAVGRRVYFPPLSEAEKAPIQAALGDLVTVANPLDYHTYCWGKREIMEAAYSGMVGNGFDLNYLILDFPHRERCEDWEWMIAVDAFDAALKTNMAKGAFVVSMPENISEDYAEAFSERGMVSFYGIDEALAASEIAADIGVAWGKVLPSPVLPLAGVGKNIKTLDEAEAKQQLAAQGVPVPPGGRLTSLQQVNELAQQLGFPLVLKALGIAHKTEHNAVRLNLSNDAEVKTAAIELFELSDQLYLEKMIPNVVAELIVGVTRDAQFGLVLTIGSGGILVEILRDTQTLLMPAGRAEIEAALNALKSAPLLDGYRGKEKADINATVDAIMAIQNYAIANELVELDVNPLLLCAAGEGVFAADALIVLEEKK